MIARTTRRRCGSSCAPAPELMHVAEIELADAMLLLCGGVIPAHRLGVVARDARARVVVPAELKLTRRIAHVCAASKDLRRARHVARLVVLLALFEDGERFGRVRGLAGRGLEDQESPGPWPVSPTSRPRLDQLALLRHPCGRSWRGCRRRHRAPSPRPAATSERPPRSSGRCRYRVGSAIPAAPGPRCDPVAPRAGTTRRRAPCPGVRPCLQPPSARDRTERPRCPAGPAARSRPWRRRTVHRATQLLLGSADPGRCRQGRQRTARAGRRHQSPGCHGSSWVPIRPRPHASDHGRTLAIYGIRGISTRVLFVTTRSRRSTGADGRGGVLMEYVPGLAPAPSERSSRVPSAVRMCRKTSAPARGRPPESASRTVYASPPPSDAGTRSRVKSTCGGPTFRDESFDTVPVCGESLALGVGPVILDAPPPGPGTLRRSEPGARGYHGSGLSACCDARTSKFGKGVVVTARSWLGA